MSLALVRPRHRVPNITQNRSLQFSTLGDGSAVLKDLSQFSLKASLKEIGAFLHDTPHLRCSGPLPQTERDPCAGGPRSFSWSRSALPRAFLLRLVRRDPEKPPRNSALSCSTEKCPQGASVRCAGFFFLLKKHFLSLL